MKEKLEKVTELLRAPKAYNNIPYVLGVLDSLIIDLKNQKEPKDKETKYNLFKK